MARPGFKEKLQEKISGTPTAVRFWLTLSVISITVNIILVLTLLQTASRLQVISQILTSPMTSTQLIEAEPFSADIGDKKLLDEMIVRYYLTMRHTFFPDDVEIQRRWSVYGPLYTLASPAVYKKFRTEIEPQLENIKKAGYTRNVDIRSVSRNGNIFTVDFDLHTLTEGVHSTENRIAILEITHDPNNIFYISDYANPYGLTITKYAEDKKR